MSEGYKVEYVNNVPQITAALDKNADAWIKQSAQILRNAVRDTSRKKSGDLKKFWRYEITSSGDEQIAKVGSPLENALWEEFGTGEYAVEGGGKKGYWVYVEGEGGDSKKSGKTYTLEEAKKIVAIMRSKGLEAYYTKGKNPSHALQRAFDVKKAEIKALYERLVGGALK